MIDEKAFFFFFLDFNPKRMSDDEVKDLSIPQDLVAFVADHRQYPLNIAKLFPDGTAWFDSQQPWFFRYAMENEESVQKLLDSEVLLLSGSGHQKRFSWS